MLIIAEDLSPAGGDVFLLCDETSVREQSCKFLSLFFSLPISLIRSLLQSAHGARGLLIQEPCKALLGGRWEFAEAPGWRISIFCAVRGNGDSVGWDTSPPSELGEVSALVPGHRELPWCPEWPWKSRKLVTSSAKAALHPGKGQGPLVTLLGQPPPAPECWVTSPKEPVNVS